MHYLLYRAFLLPRMGTSVLLALFINLLSTVSVHTRRASPHCESSIENKCVGIGRSDTLIVFIRSVVCQYVILILTARLSNGRSTCKIECH